MEKVDKEKFMSEIWQRYNETNDMEFLAKACEEAPFFGKIHERNLATIQ